MNISFQFIFVVLTLSWSFKMIPAEAAVPPSLTFEIPQERLTLIPKDSPDAAQVVEIYRESEVEYEFVIVDEKELGYRLEELTDEDLFGKGGVAESFGYLLDMAGSGKASSRCYRGGKCVLRDGEASWYGPGFQGNPTACGERFDTNELTAAHKELPFGTLVRVSYKGRSVVVRINDRGPYAHGRVIDLSYAAKEAIGLPGIGDVKLSIVRCGGNG